MFSVRDTPFTLGSLKGSAKKASYLSTWIKWEELGCNSSNSDDEFFVDGKQPTETRGKTERIRGGKILALYVEKNNNKSVSWNTNKTKFLLQLKERNCRGKKQQQEQEQQKEDLSHALLN